MRCCSKGNLSLYILTKSCSFASSGGHISFLTSHMLCKHKQARIMKFWFFKCSSFSFNSARHLVFNLPNAFSITFCIAACFLLNLSLFLSWPATRKREVQKMCRHTQNLQWFGTALEYPIQGSVPFTTRFPNYEVILNNYCLNILLSCILPGLPYRTSINRPNWSHIAYSMHINWGEAFAAMVSCIAINRSLCAIHCPYYLRNGCSTSLSCLIARLEEAFVIQTKLFKLSS
jgi:hypothetical protein